MAVVTADRLAAPALAAAVALSAVTRGLTGPARDHCTRAAGQAPRARLHLPGTDARIAVGVVDDLTRTLDDIRGIAAAYARIAGDPIADRTLPGDTLPLGQEMVAAIGRRADQAGRVVDYLAALHAQRARAITHAGADRYSGGYEPRPATPAATASARAVDPLPAAVAVAGAFLALVIVVLLLSRCGSDPAPHALTAAVQTWSVR